MQPSTNITGLYGLILEHEGINFALFDEYLKLEQLCCNWDAMILQSGALLSEVIPELGGMERTVRESMQTGSEISIQRINRTRNNENLYLDLRLIPFENKLLVVLKDTSKYGAMEQNIIQQRNETLLLNNELEKSRKLLEELSALDDLTKLPNRRAAHQIFQHKLQYAKIKQYPLSVIFLDLDNFKKINDRYGHENGDLALKFLANILQSHIRSEDTSIRWGGDEFVIMLADSENEGAKRIANLLISALEEHPVKLLSDVNFHIKASMGICQIKPSQFEEASLLDVIRTADHAMYISKRNGGKQITCLDLEATKE